MQMVHFIYTIFHTGLLPRHLYELTKTRLAFSPVFGKSLLKDDEHAKNQALRNKTKIGIINFFCLCQKRFRGRFHAVVAQPQRSSISIQIGKQ